MTHRKYFPYKVMCDMFYKKTSIIVTLQAINNFQSLCGSASTSLIQLTLQDECYLQIDLFHSADQYFVDIYTSLLCKLADRK